MKVLTDNSLTILWNRLKKGILNNRNYEPTEFSGKGYKVLEKNIQTIDSVRKNILTSAMINQPNTVYEIRHDFDLNGETIEMQEGCTLKFCGGSLKNGNITGTNTIINAPETSIFTNIKILGTWNVNTIYASWFSDVQNENVLKEVINLSSDDINNSIYVNSGLTCIVSQSINESDVNDQKGVIALKSHTTLYLNGIISLKENNLYGYSIISINAKKNVNILGSGSIIGDKDNHKNSTVPGFTTNEWGYGVFVYKSSNVTIDGISISKCIGDAIMITGAISGVFSNNITIKNVSLSDCRRQGVSIERVNNILIDSFTITGISGTAPQYGIDIEPYSGIVSNITIQNGTIEDCKGGSILVYGTDNTTISNVVINNITHRKCTGVSAQKVNNIVICRAKAEGITTGSFNHCKQLIIKDSIIGGTYVSSLIIEESVEQACIENCIIKASVSANNTTYRNCIFKTNSRAINSYDHLNISNVKVDNCIFVNSIPIVSGVIKNLDICNSLFYIIKATSPVDSAGYFINANNVNYIGNTIYSDKNILNVSDSPSNIHNFRIMNNRLYTSLDGAGLVLGSAKCTVINNLYKCSIGSENEPNNYKDTISNIDFSIPDYLLNL